MSDAQRLESILITNDGTRNDKLKMISCNCTTDYKMNCCRCKKQYHIHYIVEKRVEGDGICSMNVPEPFNNDEVE